MARWIKPEQQPDYAEAVDSLSVAEAPVPHRRRSNPAAPSTARPVVLRVHPQVWQRAKAITGGGMRRVEVRSTTEVVIHNNPQWRKKK